MAPRDFTSQMKPQTTHLAAFQPSCTHHRLVAEVLDATCSLQQVAGKHDRFLQLDMERRNRLSIVAATQRMSLLNDATHHEMGNRNAHIWDLSFWLKFS